MHKSITINVHGHSFSIPEELVTDVEPVVEQISNDVWNGGFDITLPTKQVARVSNEFPSEADAKKYAYEATQAIKEYLEK